MTLSTRRAGKPITVDRTAESTHPGCRLCDTSTSPIDDIEEIPAMDQSRMAYNNLSVADPLGPRQEALFTQRACPTIDDEDSLVERFRKPMDHDNAETRCDPAIRDRLLYKLQAAGFIDGGEVVNPQQTE